MNKILIIDNYNYFTYNIVNIVKKLSKETVYVF